MDRHHEVVAGGCMDKGVEQQGWERETTWHNEGMMTRQEDGRTTG